MKVLHFVTQIFIIQYSLHFTEETNHPRKSSDLETKLLHKFSF